MDRGAPINCTAGAVPVKNEKGELTMKKVKVSRYVAGKRPEYAKYSSDEEDEEEDMLGEPFVKEREIDEQEMDKVFQKAEKTDRRLRRLQERVKEEDDEMEEGHRRRPHEPEVVAMGDEEVSGEEDEGNQRRVQRMEESSDEGEEHEEEEEEEEEDLDEEAIERRRSMLRERARQKESEKDLLDLEDEAKSDEEEEEEESSEYEEYTDSEEEANPRLKPVFVRKSDRITVQEREKMELDQERKEEEKKKANEERTKTSRKLVEELLRKELQEEQEVDDVEDVIITDDEDDEEEYESWKVRELKRIKRDREEREQMEKERQEVDRLHNLNEDDWRNEVRNNPKVITNKAVKGKYKFLQKYYHRGAFFLDKDDDVYTRDFAKPTLEDHFDKTIIPKVMQVKNFGRSGRTKYSHLVDQDTTQMDSPWTQDNTLAMKFHTVRAGGSKQTFQRPSKRRK
ncbi:microfibrillar-associated protein 1-like [Montipora capricornis]|uniref:microfibrillar-associated protein 1-like n=1 Tax=Montipora capricornis TaxID=246305 RepID=UPI0035F1C89F